MAKKRSQKNSFKLLIVAGVLLVGSAIGVAVYQANRTFEYNGQQYRVGESFRDSEDCNTCSFDENGQLLCTLMACNVDGLPPDQTIDIAFSYANGTYTYTGTVQKPTPCHTVESEVIIRESFPEQVDLRFIIKDSGQICAQVLDEEAVSGEIRVSEGASIRVFVNDRLEVEQGVNT